MQKKIKRIMSFLLVFALIAGILPANTVHAAEDLMQFYVVDKASMEPILFGSAAKSADLYAVCAELKNKGCKIYDAYLDEACTQEAIQEEGSITTVTEKTNYYFLVDAPNHRITYTAYYEDGKEAGSGYYKSSQGFYFTYDISKFESKLAENNLQIEGWYAVYDAETKTFSEPITDTNINVTDADVNVYAKVKSNFSVTVTENPVSTTEPLSTPGAEIPPATNEPVAHDTIINIGQIIAKITTTGNNAYNLKTKLDEIAANNNIKILGVYSDAAYTSEIVGTDAVILSAFDNIYVKTQKVLYTCIQVANGKTSTFTTDRDTSMTMDSLQAFLESTIKGNNIKLSAYKDSEFTQPVDMDYFNQDIETINVFVKIENETIIVDKKTFTLVFDLNTPEGITSSGSQTVSATEGTSYKLPEVNCPGYIFEGWYDGDKKVETPYTVTKDVTLKAKWTKDESVKGPATYNIICDNSIQSYTISQGGEIDITEYINAKKAEGYLVLGVYLDKDYEYKIEDLTKVDVSVISDIYIRVQYLRYHYNDTVTDMAYKTNKTVMENKALYEATFMNAGSYKFEYYMDKDGKIPFDSINATTNARPYIDIYVNTIITDPNIPQMYTITFEPQWPVEKATKYSPQTVSGANGASVVLEDASCYGYVFLGWYLDSKYITKASNPYVFNGKSVRLYAKWEKEDPNKKWTVTFNANTGKCDIPSRAVTNGTAIGELPEATKDGYYFIGWFTDKIGGTQITKDTVITTDTTIYAQYSNREYSISYRMNSGINNKLNPNKYIQGQQIKLADPYRGGYIFQGWYTDAKCTIRVTSINQSTKGNLTFYAKWKKAKAPKAKIASLKNVKKKKIKISIKKQKGVTGYQIKFSTSKKYNKGTIGTVTMEMNKYTIKKLKKRKKYYIKVRSYVKDSTGRKIYGKWTKSKTVKIKK